MKKKTLLVTLISVSMALVVAAVGVTLAWYTNRSAADEIWELTANGFIILQFEEDITTSDTKLKPAILKKDDLNSGITDYSVDVLDETDPHITSPATKVTYEGFVRYINGEAETSGDRAANITINAEAYMEFANGERRTLSLERDIGLLLTVDIEFNDTSRSPETKTPTPGQSFLVDDNCQMTIDVEMWLRRPDELCSPYILNAQSVKLSLSINAVPVAGETQP